MMSISKKTLICKLYCMQSGDTCRILVEVVCSNFVVNLAKCVYYFVFFVVFFVVFVHCRVLYENCICISACNFMVVMHPKTCPTNNCGNMYEALINTVVAN